MGIFDKVKSFTNALTGGGAKVWVEAAAPSFTDPFEVKVKASVGDAPLDVARVYLFLEGHEEINIPDNRNCYDQHGNLTHMGHNQTMNSTTVSVEVGVSGREMLGANQEYEWSAQVDIPDGSPPAYRGRHCRHVFRVKAGLDCSGNDPDSGWVDLNLV